MGRLARNMLFAAAAVLCGMSSAAAQVGCCDPGAADCAHPGYVGARVALIIGIDKYGGDTVDPGRIADLRNAVNDARTMATVLAPHFKTVRCLKNVTRDQFYDELKKLKAHMQVISEMPWQDRQNSSVVVHFSGHGFRADEGDFILFSGDFRTLEQAVDDGALALFHLTNSLKHFPNIETTIVLDACRVIRNGTLVRPNWLGTGFSVPQDGHLKGEGLTMVYAASKGEFAHDQNPTVGGNSNGAFVYSVKPYFDLVGLDLEHVYKMLVRDKAMQVIKQQPDVSRKAPTSSYPWNGAISMSLFRERGLTLRVSDCVREGDHATGCIPAVCALIDAHEVLDRREIGVVSTIRKRLTAAFPDIAACMPSVAVADASGPLTAVLNVARVQGAADVGLRELRRQALLSPTAVARRPSGGRAPASAPPAGETRAKVEDLSANLPPGKTKAPLDAVLPLRKEILAASRDTSGREGPFARFATAPLKAAPGQIELFNLPGTVGGTIGTLKPTGTPKIDCRTQFCDEDWVAVRVPQGRTYVDGWMEAAKVIAAEPIAELSVTFIDQSPIPTPETQEKLRAFIDSVNKNPNAIVKVTGVYAATSDETQTLLSAARSAQMEYLLGTQVRKGTKIETRIIEASQPGNVAPVTLELLRP